MTTKSYDVAIIGVGTSGMRAYREASKFTNSIALIEGQQFGTTCARVGCMPSKLLIAPAEARHRAEQFSAFGLKGAVPEVDGKAVMKRVRDERDRFVGFVKEAVQGFEVDRIMAYAHFEDNNTLKLSNGDTIKAGRIVIATGSHPHVPAMFDDVREHVVTTDELFYWDDLPKSVAVFGSGVIGLELGQALHRLGVRTVLFGRGGNVGPLKDPEILACANKTFQAEFPFYSDAVVISVSLGGEGVQISYQKDASSPEKTDTFELVLAATGRRPNVDRLKLENTSLDLDDRGMPLYDPQSMQCGDSAIFVAGDVTGDAPILHEAADEGSIAGENAGRYPEVYKRARKTPLGVVFSDPQIAMAGASYAQLKKEGRDFAIGQVDFEDQGRARVMLVNKGLMSLYGDPQTGKLIGAEMIGPGHEHLAHLLSWCIQMRMSVEDILQMPFYHPVIEEGLRSGLRNLLKEMGMGPKPPQRCLDCGPGS